MNARCEESLLAAVSLVPEVLFLALLLSLKWPPNAAMKRIKKH